MNHFTQYVTAIALLCSSALAHAGTMGKSQFSGMYLGFGGSYAYAHMEANSSANLNALSGFPPLALFSGITGNYNQSDASVSPDVYAGFLHPFTSEWLGGVELNYNYSRTGFTYLGAFEVAAPSVGVTDQLRLNPLKNKVTSNLKMPFSIGRSFNNSFFYLGAGPAVFQVQQQLSVTDALSGFYLGSIERLSQQQWVWGGAVDAGLAYYLNPTWFLKVNYSYARTQNYTMNQSGSFSRQVNGGLNGGTFGMATHQQIKIHDLALSLNKLF